MLEDNTCHFGVNNFFSDLGLKSKHAPDTQLFFPADVHQTSKVVEAVFWQSGLRFIYTTRSKADRCRPKRMIKDGFHSSLWTWRFDRFCTCLLSLALEGQFGIIWHHIQMLRTERMLLSRFIACRFSTVPIRFFLCCCGCQQPQRADWLAPSFPWPTYDAQGFVCFLIIDLFGLSADDRGLVQALFSLPWLLQVPEILDDTGRAVFGDGYEFQLGKDDLIWGNTTCDGYIVSYGDALYRSLDAVHRLQRMGVAVGLVNKCHVNAVDEDTR